MNRDVARSALVTAIAVSLGAAGCTEEADARPQWLVTLSTDAMGPYWGDRVLVEVLTDAGGDACAGTLIPSETTSAALACRRVLAASTPADWPLSFGIGAPGDGSPLRVRAVLYRSTYVDDTGLPARPARIEVTAELPPASGVTPVLLELPMSCFGVVADVEERMTCVRGATTLVAEPILPVDPDLASALVAGSWGPGQTVPCPTAPPAGMACIPGGAFLLGTFDGLSSSQPGFDTVPEIPVQISPFFLDVDEVTAGEASDLGAAIGLSPILQDPDPLSDLHACSATPDGSKDALPANCLSKAFARAACDARGGRLPTEAEWEYAASGAGIEMPFAWGLADSVEEVCSRTVIGRGRTDITSVAAYEDSGCRSVGGGEILPWGPTAEGDAEDVTPQGIRNMSGNMGEWVEGIPTPYVGACWQGAVPLVDPICETFDSTSLNGGSVRGGAWNEAPYFAHVAIRRATDGVTPSRGFRCAE